MLLSSDRDVSKILKMKKILFLKIAKGPIIFSVCVWGGGVNFERGEQKKSRFDKGGNKVWPKYGKGEKELRIRPGGGGYVF